MHAADVTPAVAPCRQGRRRRYPEMLVRAPEPGTPCRRQRRVPEMMTFARRVSTRRGDASGSSPAAYPSRWRVDQHHFVDENGFDLGVIKGANWNVIGQPFAQSDFNDLATLCAGAAVAGKGLIRAVVTWDEFEPTTQGVFAGISSATGAATAGTPFSQLDITIQRAYAAGLYVYLDLHLLDPGSSNGRVPAWARTGTLPSGSGNSWTWFITNGQGITQTLAQRYGDPATSPIGAAAKAVVGFSPNEPPAASIPQIQSGFATLVPWWQAYAPLWPVWISPTSYGGGTPYPTGATGVDVVALLALDVNSRGVAIDWHNYLNMVGAAAADGYQSNGAIGPIQQIGSGAEFHGWGGLYDYPNTSASRAAITAHMAPLVTLRDQHPSIAICLVEFGMDHEEAGSNHDAWILDTINAARAAGFTVELWWQHGYGTTGFDDRTGAGGAYRAGISGVSWYANATARAAGATSPPTPPTTPPTVRGVGTVGVTPDTATAAMTATGMGWPAGIDSTWAGDLALMFVFFNTGATTSGQSITAPAGWSQFVDLPHLTNGDMLRVYCKAVAGSEGTPASPTFNGATTGTAGGVGMCQIVVLADVDTVALPGSALAGQSTGNGISGQQNLALNGFTPTAANTLVFVFAGKKDDWTSVATLTGDGLTWTEQFESVTTNAGDAGMVLDTAPIAGAAIAITTKTFTVTGGAAANGLGIMFAVKPG